MKYEKLIEEIQADKTGLAKGYSISFLQSEFCFAIDGEANFKKRIEEDRKLFETIEMKFLASNFPQQGDFVEYEDGKYARLCCTHNPNFQLSNKIGVYVSIGGAIASGCTWDSDLPHIKRERLVIENLIPTDEIKKGRCWTFSQNYPGSDRGVYFEINFKVWRLK